MTSKETRLERRVRRLGFILKSLENFVREPEEFSTALDKLEEEVIETREDVDRELRQETEDIKAADKYREETKPEPESSSIEDEPEDTVPDFGDGWPF